MPHKTKAGAAATTQVALLRGINVGGKNLVPMKELAALFDDAGCTDVKTYIQSGNVVFAGPTAPGLAARLEARIAARFGFRVPLVLRTGDELAAVARSNPFLEPGVDPGTLLVMFLADRPRAASVASLDANRSPPDQFVVRGREIYARCPGGFGRSKLTNHYFDSKLETTSTGRNWRTVLKLLEMLQR